MYYEINISFKGSHLFATAERSATDEHEAKDLFDLFQHKFPESEGFSVTVTKWTEKGERVEFAKQGAKAE